MAASNKQAGQPAPMEIYGQHGKLAAVVKIITYVYIGVIVALLADLSWSVVRVSKSGFLITRYSRKGYGRAEFVKWQG